jgi:Xaa-Pro aminopeptidase
MAALFMYGDSYRFPDIYHASGFLAPDAFAYIERDAERIIVTSALESGRARKESRATSVRELREFGYEKLVAEGLDHDGAAARTIPRALRELGIDAVRVPSTLPFFLADALRAHGISLELATDLGERRRRKRDTEIAAIEVSQRATEEAFDLAVALLRGAKVGADGTLHSEGRPLTAEMLRARMLIALLERECAGEDIILAPGPQAADPHLIGSGPYRAGEAIVLDIFPQHRRTRYFADMTRTVSRGKPTAEIARMYDAVLRAQEAGLAAIRPGVTGREVHERVEDTLYAAGFATLREGQRRDGVPAFIHGTGHGVGLEIHEEPRLSRAGHGPLQVGDVVTVEPGLYQEGVGGVRLEDMVVVTETGCRNLTRAPKSLTL